MTLKLARKKNLAKQLISNSQANLGTLYIPTNVPDNSASNKQQLANQQTPPWMATRDNREKAEWADSENQQQSNAQKPSLNRWGNNAGEILVSPNIDNSQNAAQNQLFNNAARRSSNDGPKVKLYLIC